MSWMFNPPPGWLPQPAGWVPPPGWVPDPSWPPAPATWQFWVPAGSAPAAPPSSPAPAPAETPAATLPDATVAPAAGPVDPYAAVPLEAGQPPGPGPGPAAPFAPVSGSAALPPAGFPPASSPPAGRPWFGRWWAIAGLVALLLVGSALGYGGTRVALELASDSGPLSTSDPGQDDPGGGADPGAQPSPPAGESPAPTPRPGLPLPTLVPPAGGQICGEVAIIMLTMVTATVESEDFEQYVDAVVEARRTAAGELRTLAGEATDEPQRTALETFADELDASAQMAEDNPDDQGTLEDSFDRVSDAYETFGDENC